MTLKKFTLTLVLLIPFALNGMQEAETNSTSQKKTKTIFNLNIEASLVNKHNELLSKRALNCTACADRTVTEHSNSLLPFVTDVSSKTEAEAATQYGTEIKMEPVFACPDLKSTIVSLRCAITKTLNGKTELLQPNQRVQFIVIGIRETTHEERIDCAEELTLKVTAKRSLSELEQLALALGKGNTSFFD